MNGLRTETIMNQKKVSFHLAVLVLSVTMTEIYSILKGAWIPNADSFRFLLFIFIQIEVFMFIASLIFKGNKDEKTRKEITLTVIRRFAIFYFSCLVAALVLFIIFQIAYNIRSMPPEEIVNNFFRTQFSSWLKETTTGLFFGAMIFVVILWQGALKREQKLREENLVFQNETLKTQINPHFLFNNLNTLSSLIVSRSDIAEIFIARLSSIYRYITENFTKDKVILTTELNFIKDYFYLYQIRDEDKISMEILAEGADNYYIIPVSLQILVENAIKHNRATREEPLQISVYIEGQSIVVRNNLQRMASQIRSTGIGLRNLTERVKLISGNEIIIEESSNFFTVKIPLLK